MPPPRTRTPPPLLGKLEQSIICKKATTSGWSELLTDLSWCTVAAGWISGFLGFSWVSY